MKKKEWVESLMDDEMEDGGDADLDQVLAVLQHPRPHLRPGQTLQLKFWKVYLKRADVKNTPAVNIHIYPIMKKLLPMTFPDLKICLLFMNATR